MASFWMLASFLLDREPGRVGFGVATDLVLVVVLVISHFWLSGSWLQEAGLDRDDGGDVAECLARVELATTGARDAIGIAARPCARPTTRSDVHGPIREGDETIISGPPVPRPGEERFFPAAQVSVAWGWALAGGIAVIDGRDRLGPAYHVCGRHALLLVWATRHGLDCSRLRSATRILPARFDVSGPLAQVLKGRARSDDADPHPPQPCLEGPASAGPSGRRRNAGLAR